jgi:hypothetical protein
MRLQKSMMPFFRSPSRLVLLMTCVAGAALSAAQSDPDSIAGVIARAGERVERFFLRAQTLVCIERVSLQALSSGWTSEGFPRVVESELRVSWGNGAEGLPAEPQTLRQLLRVNGHPPRKDDWKNCTTPEQTTEEEQPLALLLPARRSDYAFTAGGTAMLDGRAAIIVGYRLLKKASAESRLVDGRDDCINFDVEGGMRGRIWIDAETHEVLRLDQHLTGMVDIPLPRAVTRWRSGPDYWTMERWDTSIRFARVAFKGPDEVLVLPQSLSSVQVVRGAGTPRLRTTIEYANYQRFLTGGRVVGN